MSTLPNSQDIYAEGIVSFHLGICEEIILPNVASNVSEFIEWISDNIEP